MLTAVALTCAAPAVFPAPANREAALADLEHSVTERRAEAVVWVANHGGIADQPLLFKRLRDESPFVRGYAEQGLWLLWSRSGSAAIDRQMALGMEQMQSGRLHEALATFGAVIGQRPEFAEGWNKRATAYYLKGEYRKSLADCDEVITRNPYHYGALSGYGMIYVQLDQPVRAIEYFEKALAVNPNMDGVRDTVETLKQIVIRQRKDAI